MNEKQTKSPHSMDALISLMRDPDPHVWPFVEEQLLNVGASVRELLQQEAERGENTLAQARARETLGKIHEHWMTDRLRRWVNPGGPDPNLEEGWFLLTRLEYPELNEDNYRNRLDEMAADIDLLLRGVRDLDALKVLQRYLHFDSEFRGNVQGYGEPENSYLNCVLDRKLGIPISLSSLYLLIARRIGLPLEGISAPGHFLVRFRRDRAGAEPVYIDTFHGGRNMSRQECVSFLRTMGYSVQSELDAPVGSRAILARMCRNLIAIYDGSGADQKRDRLLAWENVIQSASPSDTFGSSDS